jgi:ABC-type lipoprotein export system ATPase subunit
MNANDTVDPVVLESVRTALFLTEEQFIDAEQNVETASAAFDKAKSSRDELADKRAKLASYLAKHGAVAAPQLAPASSKGAETDVQQAPKRVSAKTAVEIVVGLLSGGRQRKVPQIIEDLAAENVVIAVDDPIRRLTQAMSASKLFEADRTLGWTLKVAHKPSEGAT